MSVLAIGAGLGNASVDLGNDCTDSSTGDGLCPLVGWMEKLKSG